MIGALAAQKPSGLSWTPFVPSHWVVANIRRFAQMKTGHTPSRSKPEYWMDCSIPWFTLADVWQLRDGTRMYVESTENQISELGLANSAAELLPERTVMLSRTASVGFSGIMNRPMATSQDFWNWVCGPRLLPEYLAYVFRAMRPEFDALMMGSTHKTIYQPVAAAITIPVPPMDEQRSIAAFLDREVTRIDTLIRNQLHLIELLGARRQSVATGILGVRVGVGERLKWMVRESDIRGGEQAGNLPLMSVSISWGVRRRSEVTNDHSRAEDLAHYKVCSAGDLVVNRMRAFQGALGVAPERGIVSPDYAVLSVVDDLDVRWLVAVMKTAAFVGEMASRVKGIGSADLGNARTPRINVADLGEIRVTIPSPSVQSTELDLVYEQSATIDTLIAETERFIELSRERRAVLITAAVTGQVDVRGEAA